MTPKHWTFFLLVAFGLFSLRPEGIADYTLLVSQVPDYWPTQGWQVSSPELQGMNPIILQEMHAFIEDGNFPLEALLVVRHGYLIYEHYPSSFYDEDDLHIIYSCTKSIISALTGIALQYGYLTSINQLVVDIFSDRTIANLDARKEAITIEHLLTMTAGFDWDDDVNFFAMQSSGNWVQYVLDCPMRANPGSEWEYNSGASHLLSAMINENSLTGTMTFAEMNLFDPLGITDYLWLTDDQNVPFGGSSLFLTPRDMAKFGFLYLQNGNWAGEQVVPESWVEASTIPQISLGGNTGYGYQWWTNGQLESFEARGYAGQYIIVIPEHDMVIVFTANDLGFQVPVGTLIYDYILAAIQELPIGLFELIPWPVLVILGVAIIGPTIVGVGYWFLRRRRQSI
ncbi:MAG: serine hydrolase domain-containing protein [Candidatus Hodarchaeota archaeon]